MRGWGQGRSPIMNDRLGSGSILYYEWRGWGRGWVSIMNERLGLGSGSVPGFSSLHIVYYIFIDNRYMIVRHTSTSIG